MLQKEIDLTAFKSSLSLLPPVRRTLHMRTPLQPFLNLQLGHLIVTYLPQPHPFQLLVVIRVSIRPEIVPRHEAVMFTEVNPRTLPRMLRGFHNPPLDQRHALPALEK